MSSMNKLMSICYLLNFKIHWPIIQNQYDPQLDNKLSNLEISTKKTLLVVTGDYWCVLLWFSDFDDTPYTVGKI